MGVAEMSREVKSEKVEEEIGRTTKSIATGTTGQTGCLSLNASIEMANAANSQDPEKLHRTAPSEKSGVQSLDEAIRSVAHERGVKYEPVNVRAVAAKSIRGMDGDGKYNMNMIRITPSAGVMEYLPKPDLGEEREEELSKAHDADGMKDRISGIMLGFAKDKVGGVCASKSLRQSILEASTNMTKAVNALVTDGTLFHTLNSPDPEERIWGARKLHEVFELAGEKYEEEALKFVDSLDFATLKKLAESSEEYSREMGGLWNSNRNALADPSNMFASFVLLNFCPLFALALLIPMLMPMFASWYSGKRAEDLKIDMNDEEALRAEAKASIIAARISGNAMMANIVSMLVCEVAPSELQKEMEKFHSESSSVVEKMRERLAKAFLEAGRSTADGKTVTGKGAAHLGLTSALEEVSLEAAKLVVGAAGDVDENGFCEPGLKFAERMGALREVATTYSGMEMFEVDFDETTSKPRMKLDETHLETMNKKGGFYSALASDIKADAENYLENQNLVSSVADYAAQYARMEGRSGVVGETVLEMLRLRKLDATNAGVVNENSAYHYSRYGFTRLSNGVRVGKQVDVKSSTILSAVKCLSKYIRPETLAALEEVFEQMEKKKNEGQTTARKFLLNECNAEDDNCVLSVVSAAKNKNSDLDEDILKKEVVNVFENITTQFGYEPSFEDIESLLNEQILDMKKRSAESPVRGFIADMSMRIVPQEAWGSLCGVDEDFLKENKRLNRDLPFSLRPELERDENGFSVSEVVAACEKMHEARKSLIVAAVLSRQLEVEMAARVARGEDVPSTAERLVASALAAHVSNACRMEREAAPALEKFDRLPKTKRNTPAFNHLSSFVFAAHADLGTRKKSLGERLGDFGRVLGADVVKTLSKAKVADEKLLFENKKEDVAAEMSKRALKMESELVEDLMNNLAEMDEKWTREFVSTSVSWCNATSMSGLLGKLVGRHVDAEVSSASTSGLETRAAEPKVPESGDEENKQAWSLSL